MNSVNDSELKGVIDTFIESVYSEINNYDVLLGEDFLTTGIHRFLVQLNKGRQWGSRVLNLMIDARRYRDRALHLARGKRMLFEQKCILYIKDERKNMPSGLDGQERKALAQLENADYQEDWYLWETVANELRSMVEVLTQKHKDLLSAKQDLRAQLWAVKLQGMLGELGKEALFDDKVSTLGMERNITTPSMTETKPLFAGGGEGSSAETEGLDMDSLLGGKA